MSAPDIETLLQRFAEYPTELLGVARGLASANGDGPDPGLVSDADDLAGTVMRDDDRLTQLQKDPVAAKRRLPFRQAAERLVVDPAGVARDLERRLTTSHDRETGRRQTRLEALNGLSGEVEFAFEPSQFDNGDWLFELMGKRAPKEGVVVKVRLSERQVTMPRDLEDRISMARCGDLPHFTRGKDEWRAFRNALIEASEVVEQGGTDADAWHRRLVSYLDGVESRKFSPEDAEDREQLVKTPRPFTHVDGSIWLHVPSFYEALAVKRIDARNGQVEAALGDLGWQAQTIKTRIEGKQRRRNYWRSPDGFDPGSDR